MRSAKASAYDGPHQTDPESFFTDHADGNIARFDAGSDNKMICAA